VERGQRAGDVRPGRFGGRWQGKLQGRAAPHATSLDAGGGTTSRRRRCDVVGGAASRRHGVALLHFVVRRPPSCPRPSSGLCEVAQLVTGRIDTAGTVGSTHSPPAKWMRPDPARRDRWAVGGLRGGRGRRFRRHMGGGGRRG
jgi:hypothetical protein